MSARMTGKIWGFTGYPLPLFALHLRQVEGDDSEARPSLADMSSKQEGPQTISKLDQLGLFHKANLNFKWIYDGYIIYIYAYIYIYTYPRLVRWGNTSNHECFCAQQLHQLHGGFCGLNARTIG